MIGAFSMSETTGERTIPLLEEQLSVGKAQVVTDRLRVSTTVEERPVLIEEVVERGELHVERIAVDRAVAEAPAPRQDGDTLIVSIVEERLVVKKRLFVIEELHITRTSSSERVAIPETVRRMRATVERDDPAASRGRDSDG